MVESVLGLKIKYEPVDFDTVYVLNATISIEQGKSSKTFLTSERIGTILQKNSLKKGTYFGRMSLSYAKRSGLLSIWENYPYKEGTRHAFSKLTLADIIQRRVIRELQKTHPKIRAIQGLAPEKSMVNKLIRMRLTKAEIYGKIAPTRFSNATKARIARGRKLRLRTTKKS